MFKKEIGIEVREKREKLKPLEQKKS